MLLCAGLGNARVTPRAQLVLSHRNPGVGCYCVRLYVWLWFYCTSAVVM